MAVLRTRPYRPQSNGKVERLNHNINLEWAYASVWRQPGPSGRPPRLGVHTYNHHRPHTALGGRSPMQTLNNLPGNHT
jgi:transposase InsO family protein